MGKLVTVCWCAPSLSGMDLLPVPGFGRLWVYTCEKQPGVRIYPMQGGNRVAGGAGTLADVCCHHSANAEPRCPRSWGGGKVGLTLPLWEAAGVRAVQTSASPGTHQGRAWGGAGGPSPEVTARRELPPHSSLGEDGQQQEGGR